jgi:hypothetical protein
LPQKPLSLLFGNKLERLWLARICSLVLYQFADFSNKVPRSTVLRKWVPSLALNIRLGCLCFSVTNGLAYCPKSESECEEFYKIGHWFQLVDKRHR